MTCPSCGSPAPERARFCPECGNRLDAGQPQEPSFLERFARDADQALTRARVRAGQVVRTVGVRESARARIARLRAHEARLTSEREAGLRQLGAAVYEGDGPETDRARATLAVIDAQIDALREEMDTVLQQAQARVAELDAEAKPTEMYTRPVPPDEPGQEPIKEPWPPPDEADPPQPAIVPEPSPQPIPEPYPPGEQES